jgi:hypothetical protein
MTSAMLGQLASPDSADFSSDTMRSADFFPLFPRNIPLLGQVAEFVIESS